MTKTLIIRHVHQWGGQILDRCFWEGVIEGENEVYDWDTKEHLIELAKRENMNWKVLRHIEMEQYLLLNNHKRIKMNKNLKDEITEILDKSGLVDIHLAQGLIVQPIIEYIKNNLPENDEIIKIIDEEAEWFHVAIPKENAFRHCIERHILTKIKKGLGLNE